MPRENEAEVLEYLNGLREKYGIGEPLKELPPDMTADQTHPSINCPVAVALETQLGYGGAHLGGEFVTFPDYVTQFQMEHDARRWR